MSTFYIRQFPPPGLLTIKPCLRADNGLVLVDIDIIARIFPDNNKLLAYWLSPAERVYLNRLRFSKRHNEWLAGRIAAKWGLLRQRGESSKPAQYSILPDVHGCPRLSPLLPGGHISISHSHCFCAALTADFPCGIDIQIISQQILRVRKRIATEIEIDIARREVRDDDEAAMTLIWSIKEAVKKHCLSSQPGIFEAITIQSIRATDEKNRFKAECFVSSINHKQSVNIIRLNQYMLAWSTGKYKNQKNA